MEDNEGKEEGYSVILEDWASVAKTVDLAGALVKASDILWADALITAGKRRGIICRGLKKEKAEELVERLKTLGVGAFMVSESGLIKVPKAMKASKLSCLPDALLVSLEPGGKIYPARWEDILAVSCGYVRQTVKSKDHLSGERFGGILGEHIPYLPVGGALGAGLALSLASWSWFAGHPAGGNVEYRLLLDITIKNPIARFRAESTHLAYAELGEKMKPDTRGNFKEIIEEIVSRSPQACLEDGVEMMLGRNKEVHRITFESLEEFDWYDAWLAQKAGHRARQLEESHF